MMIFPALNAKLLTASDAWDAKADDVNENITAVMITARKIFTVMIICPPNEFSRPHIFCKTVFVNETFIIIVVVVIPMWRYSAKKISP